MLLIKVIGISIECILGNDRIIDSWKLSFKKNDNFEQLVNLWKPVVENGGLRSIKEAESVGSKIRDVISAVSEAVSVQVKDFVDSVDTKGAIRK